MVMLGFIKKTPQHHAALAQVRAWTRARFKLGEDDTILVSEVSCQVPGCPPLETVVAFWTGQGRHHFKVFKPVAEVVEDDLPPGWMKNALVVPEGIDCECC
jgi:nitrate reductase delta subunit